MRGCQELEDRLDSLEGIRDQLGEIQRRQTGIQNAFDVLLHRLERVESSKLRPIRKESVSPPGQQTVDGVRSMPQLARPSFVETREEWEKRVETSEKELSLSRTTTILQEPLRVSVKD